MRKEKVVGELKFHSGSGDSALETLKPLGLGRSRTEEIIDTYQDKDEVTRRIYKTQTRRTWLK